MAQVCTPRLRSSRSPATPSHFVEAPVAKINADAAHHTKNEFIQLNPWGKKKGFVSDSVDQPIDTSSEDYARPRPNQSSKLNDLLTGDGHGVGSLAGDAKGAAAHVDVFNLALLKGGPVLLCLRRQLEDQLDGVHAVLEPRVWNHRHAGK